MGYPKAQFEQDVTEVRERIRAVRDNAKAQGIPNTRFYQELMDRITPYGVRASMSWLREQCDPENITPPSLRKLFALKQALDEYQSQTGITAEVEAEDVDDGPRTVGHPDDDAPLIPIELEEVDMAHLAESLETVGKIALENPSRAVLLAAQFLNMSLKTHSDKGGKIMPFLAYLRARMLFTHDMTLSNMPLHTIREVRTKAQAEALNPSFKTIAALLYTLSAIGSVHNKFPWGDDKNLEATVKDILAQQAEAQKKLEKKRKHRSLAQQNKDMIRNAVGTTVIKIAWP